MTPTHGIKAQQPVPLLDRPVKLKPKEFLFGIGKMLGAVPTGNWKDLGQGALDTIGAGTPQDDVGQVAWLLVQRALVRAIFALIEEQELNLREAWKETSSVAIEAVEAKLNEIECTLPPDFFEHPAHLPLLRDMQAIVAEWLCAAGLLAAQAQTIVARLPSYFVDALHEEWHEKRATYQRLQTELTTPFTQASQRVATWQRYRANLIKQIDLPMFGESFGLNAVYVPLRAYWDEVNPQSKARERKAGVLQDTLLGWLAQQDRDDPLRVVSGGPGSGKSSSAKMLAAELATQSDLQVLFVPLHQLNVEEDFIEAVGSFVEYDPILCQLSENPLHPKCLQQRIVLILDGLDELSKQGQVGSELARQFIQEVEKKIASLNQAKDRMVQVLLTGREIVVQANQTEFRNPNQILHVLPYFIEEDEHQALKLGSVGCLREDQRNSWWQNYGRASGRDYTAMPLALRQGRLNEVTAQPLLNYLVALSYVRSTLDFSQKTNLNRIYDDLLSAVYQRGWEREKHIATRGLQQTEFVRILEEIGIAAWHGDGRSTTVREIEAHCKNSGFAGLLVAFQEGAQQGVTRLLTAFYFRQNGKLSSGDRTFEFTHKSFAEYLVARRLVAFLADMQDEMARRRNRPGMGWGEIDALEQWARLCGLNPLDPHSFTFLCNEVADKPLEVVQVWQQTLVQLINYRLRAGLPMERLGLSYHEQSRQARNAEETLLALLNACARKTRTISNIDWHHKTAAGDWLFFLQGQRGNNPKLAISCLSGINFSAQILQLHDFHGVNLSRANLRGVNLSGAKLRGANLSGADLSGADISRADLSGADISRAVLSRADLSRADLSRADLSGADISRAVLSRTDLSGANLSLANLSMADLRKANFNGADLSRTDLCGANLSWANLSRTNLSRTNLSKTNLRRANFSSVDLSEANLSEADTSEANFRGAILHAKDFLGITIAGINFSDVCWITDD
ncbi:MAG: pentapeptide repeat-containing protein [Gallionella sp.]